MPSASLENEEKYKNLIDSYIRLKRHKKPEDENNNNINCQLFENILESLIWLTESRDQNLTKQLLISEKAKTEGKNQKINVLITGSLYLVGLSLKILNYKID